MDAAAHPLLKLSDENLALLYPGHSVKDFAEAALGGGTTLVIVTRGGEGVEQRCVLAAQCSTW